MKNTVLAVVIFMGISVMTVMVQAQTITFSGAQDNTFTSGNPDAFYVDSGVSGEDEFEWDGSDAGGQNYGAIRFDGLVGNGIGQIPPGSTVTNAVITLNVTNEGNSGEIATVHKSLQPFNDKFSLNDVNGGPDFVAGTDYDSAVVAEVPGPSAGDVLEIDVTSAVQDWVGGEANNGLIIVPGGGNGVGIQSSEAASGGPVLTVTLSSGPTAANFGNAIDNTFTTGNPGAWYVDSGVSGEDEFEWDGSDAGGFNIGALAFSGVVGDGPGQIAPGSSVSLAIITLNVTNEGNSGEIAAIHESLKAFGDRDTLADFSGGDPVAGTDYNATVVAEIPGPSAGDVLEIDVTSAVQGWANGNANNGFLVLPGGGNGVGIQAHEATSGGPRLTVITGSSSNVNDWELLK